MAVLQTPDGRNYVAVGGCGLGSCGIGHGSLRGVGELLRLNYSMTAWIVVKDVLNN